MTTKLEKMFRTSDVVWFDVIEDENGDVFWGYGWVDKDKFIAEVNRWLAHTVGEGEELRDDLPVEHLWARLQYDSDEHFDIVEPKMTESDNELFPVTRLVL